MESKWTNKKGRWEEESQLLENNFCDYCGNAGVKLIGVNNINCEDVLCCEECFWDIRQKAYGDTRKSIKAQNKKIKNETR